MGEVCVLAVFVLCSCRIILYFFDPLSSPRRPPFLCLPSISIVPHDDDRPSPAAGGRYYEAQDHDPLGHTVASIVPEYCVDEEGEEGADEGAEGAEPRGLRH